jgi:hypothetical protein
MDYRQEGSYFDHQLHAGKELPMTDLKLNTFLKKVLLLDLVVSAATTLMLLTAAGWLAEPLGLSAVMLRGTGIVLLPWVALLAWIIWKQTVANFIIWLVIAGNAIWAIDSIAVLFTDWLAPSALGIGFIIGQAVIIGIFAELQFIALRRPRHAVTA